MWECYVGDSIKSRYYMIPGGYILTKFRQNLKMSIRVIEGGEIPLKLSTVLMVDLGT